MTRKFLQDLKDDPDFGCVVMDPRHTIEKGWGSLGNSIGEVFVYHKESQFQEDSSLICFPETVKVLYIEKGKTLSTHFHVEKEEIFYCANGLIEVVLIANGRAESVEFGCGESMFIPRGMVHSMSGLVHGPNILIEVSTLDKPEDSYRIRKGD